MNARLLIWLVVGLLLALAACASPRVDVITTMTLTPAPTRTATPSLTPTATPTRIFLEATLTPSAPAPTRAPSATPTGTPTDDFTITGNDESFDDVTTKSLYGQIQTVRRTASRFSLKSIGPNRLKGTAQITFSGEGRHGVAVPESGYTCFIAWQSGVLTWTADLDGEYQKLPDGSLLVRFSATPKEGPPYTTKSCSGDSISELSLKPYWFGGGGTLVNGVYDKRTDYPMRFGAKGEVYVVVHMGLSNSR
jgi:hypothetical protein